MKPVRLFASLLVAVVAAFFQMIVLVLTGIANWLQDD